MKELNMNSSEKDKFLERDRLLRVLSDDGRLRIAIVKTTFLVEEARKRHGLSLLATVLLGRALTGSLLLATHLKGEERIQLRFEGNGPVQGLVTEATGHGEVRGYALRPSAELDPGGRPSMDEGLGIGVLNVSKTLYNRARPVTGAVVLPRGNISEDLAHYLLQSEQIPSAVTTDVYLDGLGRVAGAGGVLVQAMPGANEQMIAHLEENIRKMPPVGLQFQNGYLEDVLRRVSRGIKVRELSRYPVDFFCRCSRERFQHSLALVNPENLLKMNGSSEELICHYCSERYSFSKEEISEIVRKAMFRRN